MFRFRKLNYIFVRRSRRVQATLRDDFSVKINFIDFISNRNVVTLSKHEV